MTLTTNLFRSKIKRGVSLYCYQQADFFHKMTWKDQLREVATGLNGATGVEIISETTIPNYPNPPESFIEEWNSEIARWGLTAVTMDTYIDSLMFRDHVMTIGECAEKLKMDLKLAHKLGFQFLRPCTNLPLAAIASVLPLAEELGVTIAREIHSPATIHPTRNVYGDVVAQAVAFIQTTGTKNYCLMPDMGIFQDRPSPVTIGYTLRGLGFNKEDSLKSADEIFDASFEMDRDAFQIWLEKNYKDLTQTRIAGMFKNGNSTDPLELFSIFPYIKCLHGKFYNMTEIPGKPGQYEERSILYKEVINLLNDCLFDGYINSEFEGQRDQQDMGVEGLVDEVEQVRRHHEMMQRLIDNDEYFIKV